jgi:hypothetical protein
VSSGAPRYRWSRRGASLAVLLVLLLSAFGTGAATHTSPPTALPPGSPVAAVPKIIDTSVLNQAEVSSVDVYASYSKEPAPMGLADYGIGPSGAYEYSTNSSLGSAIITSLSVKNSTGSPWMSMQLNENLEFYNGDKAFVYWVQDVAELDTSTNTVYFEDNIWNSTAATATMNSSGASGEGQVLNAGSGGTFYGVVASLSSPGNDVNLAYPAVVSLRVNSSVNSLKEPVVTFEYDDGYGWQEYDSVAFTSVERLTSLEGFVVDGFTYKPGGFFDSELILGGPGSGIQTTDEQSNVELQLEYWNGHNYQEITNAWLWDKTDPNRSSP